MLDRSILIAALIIGAAMCMPVALAQSLDISDYQPLVGVLPDTVDDIVIGPNGEIILSRVDIQEVGIYDPNSTTAVWTPLSTQPLLALSMELGPDGALYIGDSITHTIVRYDFVTGLLTTSSLGYFIPIDVIFDQSGSMYVADLTSSNFFTGGTDLWRVELVNGIEVSRLLLASGIPGATDVADGMNGKLYIGALGLTSIYEYDPIADTAVSVANNCFLVSDIVATESGVILASTIYNGDVTKINANTGQIEVIASALGDGSGAEDIAIDVGGKSVLVTVNTGEIHRIAIERLLRQVTPAEVGARVEWRLNAPAQPNWQFAMAIASTANSGILIPGTMQVLPLDSDALFNLSITFPRPLAFAEFNGNLNADGLAVFGMLLPNAPFLVGMTFYAAGVLYSSPTALAEDWVATNGTRVVIE
ncbi:MAG: hypothetical protein V3W41_06700 [Planctomycetota bacterium]